MDSSDNWYLRSRTGKRFGPVAFEMLIKWAHDGRVEPSALVSNDLRDWVPAPNVPELGMEWVVENKPGQFYGPTHRAVIDDFIRSGALVPGARFYRDMRSGLVDKAEFEAEAAAKAEEVSQALKDRAALTAERDKLLAERAAWAAEKQALVAKNEKDVQALVAERDALMAEKAAEADKVMKAIKDLKVLQSERDSLMVEKAAAADQAFKDLKNAHDALVEEKKSEADRASKTQEAYNDLMRKHDAALRECSDLKREHEKVAQQLADVQAEQTARAAKAEQTLAQVTEEKDKAIAALQAELEALKKESVPAEDVVVPEVIVTDTPPPSQAQQAFGHPTTGTPVATGIFGNRVTSLADLERQAQAELARMRAAGGGNGGGFFGFGRKKK